MGVFADSIKSSGRGEIVGVPERDENGGFKVYIDKELLDPTRSIRAISHSPDGFSWGYGGSGAAQLALALLLEFTDEEFAIDHYQALKIEKIEQFESGKRFRMYVADLAEWVERREG